MSDIFREIEEELRRENLRQLWSRYGRYVIAAVVLLLVLAGAFVAWRDHQASLRRVQSERFASALALMREGKNDDAAKVFEAIADGGGGYALLASFERAELLAKAGDRKGALAIYDRIAASDADPQFRNAAVLLGSMQALPDSDPAEVAKRLEPLTQSGNPWRPSALELIAAARLKTGDRAGALDLYKKLADDLTAPRGLRARAAEMAAALAS